MYNNTASHSSIARHGKQTKSEEQQTNIKNEIFEQQLKKKQSCPQKTNKCSLVLIVNLSSVLV